MIGDTRSMIWVVMGDGLAIHGDDFKALTLKLQVHVAIRGSVYEAPELALTRSDFNLRPHGPVHRHDLVWRLWFCATNVRTEFNALLQSGRLRVVRNGTATHSQDALRQAGDRREIGFYPLDHERAGHTVEHLPVALSMRVRVVPIQARRMVFRNLHGIAE